MRKKSSLITYESDQCLPVNRRPWLWLVAGMILMYVITSIYGLIFATAAITATAESPQTPIVIDAGDYFIIEASGCDISRKAKELIATGKPVRYRVKIVRIVDGDTIKVIWLDKEMSVRLRGINAPESKKPGGAESTAFLASLLDVNGYIDLEFEENFSELDSFGRLLAYLWCERVLINVEIVKAGHAGLYKEGEGKYQAGLLKAWQQN